MAALMSQHRIHVQQTNEIDLVNTKRSYCKRKQRHIFN